MMEEDFAFNAPRFYSLNGNEEDERVEAYFESDHEKIEVPHYEDISTEFTEIVENEIFSSPLTEVKLQQPRLSSVYYTPSNMGIVEKIGQLRLDSTKKSSKLRRSSSVSDIPRALAMNGENKAKQQSNKTLKHTARSGSSGNLHRISKAHGMSREHLNKLAQPKHQFTSMENISNKPFISMAEAMNKFHKGTPDRFRKKPLKNHVVTALKTTIPQSPALLTKIRHKPTTTMSSEERELAEFKEAQKFKIRAHLPNKKVIQGPMKAQVPLEKKHVTIPQPFKLTAPHKTVHEPKIEHHEFHSQPVPKTLYSKPELPIVKVKTGTVPKAPSFHKREEQVQRKKEQLKEKVLEEEKQAREFHARPLPRKIFGSPCGKPNYNTTKSSFRSTENLSTTQCNTFKAKSPTVLYKKPFVPKLDDKPLLEIQPFELNSDRRARQRKEFELELKIKEEKMERFKMEAEAEKLRQEEEQVKLLRKQAEVKAQPIKIFKPLVIMPSNKITNPISPKFMTMTRSRENKENIDF